MWISDTSIKRPVFATMFIMVLVVLGLVSYPEIGVDLFPKVDFPVVNISTHLTGAGPEIMDIDVTDRIEEAVNTINGIKSITSTSSEGSSNISVEFVLEKDINIAVQDVREQVASVRRRLPDDVDEPVIRKVNSESGAILYLYVTGERTRFELSTYIDEVLKEQFQRIEGVGALFLVGLQRRQVRIWLDAGKLRAYQIAPGDVSAALAKENIDLPGGRIEGLTKEFVVKVRGTLRQASDFNDLIVATYQGAPVRIKDIGRAEDGMEERRSIGRFNGQTALGIGIQKQSGTNTVQVVDRVKKELARIKQTLPPGVNIDIAFDQSTFIKQSIRQVEEHLIIGAILAILAVFIFLRNVRTTLISALALPISIISTFTLIRIFDFTFNNMTMLALTLSVGILIDDAIIVIENIYRHLEEGMPPREAAGFATSEIGLAVLATTVAIVVIFLPVAFMKGIIGRFFMQFALTVVFSVLVSLLVSFTLTPMLASIFLHAKNDPNRIGKKTKIRVRIENGLETGYKKVEGAYRPILSFSLKYRKSILISALLIFAASLYLTQFIGKELVPPEDQSQFTVRLEAAIDYSMIRSDELFQQAEQIVKSTPEVLTAFYSLGGFTNQVNRAQIMTRLKPKSERDRSQQQIMAELRRKLNTIPGLKATTEEISMMHGMGRNVPIQFVISSGDLPNLQKYTKQMAAELAKVPGIVDVDTSVEANKPELNVYIDRDKAGDLGVSAASVAEAVNLLISGDVTVTRFKDETRGKRYDVRVRLNPEDRQNPDDIGRLYIRAKNGDLVELANIVRIQEGGGPISVMRVNRQRSMWIYANLEGKPLATGIEDVNKLAAQVLPPEFNTAFKGMAETMGETFKYLLFAMVLGILLAYMVLASQFESFLHPIIILLAMPLSFIGALSALFFFNKTISMISFIGLILLMGLVKKNSILLVDYTNTLRARGLARREAILQAGPVRLRPILMTTFAMIFGMLPVAIGMGEGSESRSPMGIAVIGGLLTSLFLTLVVVPSAYDLVEDWKERWQQRKGQANSL
jgi:HAE1 family hydrophobic/amphiphilic exporter-1